MIARGIEVYNSETLTIDVFSINNGIVHFTGHKGHKAEYIRIEDPQRSIIIERVTDLGKALTDASPSPEEKS